MLPTYAAILRNDRLEWTADAPPAAADAGVRVHFTVLEPEPLTPAERGRRMKAALDALAASGAFSTITDPAAWEREQRVDRELPGRES